MNPTPTDADALNREIELRLFGDDLTANTEEQKRECLSTSGHLCHRSTVRVEWFTKPIAIADPCPSDWWSALWNRREGQPWQSDLEAFVRDFRFPPRNFLTGDGMLLVIGEMNKKGFAFKMKCFSGVFDVVFYLREQGNYTYGTEAGRVVATAVLAALSEVNHA